MGLFGPPNIEKMKDRRNVKGLMKALSYPDQSSIREQAAVALGELQSKQATAALIHNMQSRSFDTYNVQAAAATALGKICDESSIPVLVAILYEEPPSREYDRGRFWDLQRAARAALIQIGAPAVEPLIALLKKHGAWRVAEMLGKIGDPRAIEPLVAALKDMHSCEEVSVALEQLGWKPEADDLKAWYWVGRHDWNKCEELGTVAVEPLIRMLSRWESEIRHAAAMTLGKIGDARAVERLIASLQQDTEHKVRCAAAEALGSIGDPRAIRPLMLANAGYGYEQVEALKRLCNVSTYTTLIPLLQDPEKIVRRRAVEQLSRLQGTYIVEPLILALRDEDKDVFEKAANALASLGDGRAVGPLISLLNKNDFVSRSVAAKALVKLHRSGKLDDQQKQMVLAHRAIIANKDHVDEKEDWHHVDGGAGTRWGHEGCHTDEQQQSHSDQSYTGVNFPL